MIRSVDLAEWTLFILSETVEVPFFSCKDTDMNLEYENMMSPHWVCTCSTIMVKYKYDYM